MLRWPKRALAAVRILFEPLQDVDVYVEDSTDEAFYTRLLQRLVGEEVRIARVIAKGNRGEVVAAAMSYTGTRPALFVIDGDFEWVLGRPPPSTKRVYRMGAYCVENYLLCETAVLDVLMQELGLTEVQAKTKFDFRAFLDEVRAPLVGLFAAYAAAHALAPTHPTVARGVGRLCTDKRLDEAKVATELGLAMQAAEVAGGQEAAAEIVRSVLARADASSMPLDVVSGKDFVLPLLDFCLQEHGCRIRRKPLRMRLVWACATERLAELRNALLATARGNVFSHQ